MSVHGGQDGVDGGGTWSGAFSSLAVLNHVDVGIYSVNRAGRCMQINRAALDLLGYSEQECLGQDMHDLIHSKREDGSPYPVEECPLYLARKTGVALRNAEEILWTKSGRPVRAACSSIPIGDVQDAQGTVITINDVTSWRAAEDRLHRAEQEQREILRQRDAASRVEHEQAAMHRESSATVERVAAEQLREQQRIAEERLVQSEKLAAVGRLAASISHEINNPLEAVTNLLYLARTDPSVSEEANGYLKMAETELGRVSEIVAQTLRFQRSGAGMTDCMPNSLVESVVALHLGRLHNSNIRINQKHLRSRTVLCAEGDIRQVLNNLVSNAIDAMRDAGGILTIRTAPARDHSSGRTGIRFSIADTGHGMSRSVASRIFEPFFTTKGTDGSGLGLWISNSIMKRHGGRLTVRSSTAETCRGTTFSMFVPDATAA